MESLPDLPRIPLDRADDLHHLDIADRADLVLFMAGNQFMALADLVSEFRRQHPDIERIFYETLPPGLELKQILSGGAHFGGRILSVRPDVYTSVSRDAMDRLEAAGHIGAGDARPYLHNRLVLLVPEGNPGGIHTVADLGGESVRVSQPDPENEDIAFHIVNMYRDAGGEALVRRIMEEKRIDGTTILTLVHHRETPIRIQKRTVDAGPVWATEAIYARRSGLPCGVVEPGEPLDQRDRITYYAARLRKAPRPENAERFLAFLESDAAQDIFQNHGFVPH